jgi:hypothetical protein
MRRLVLTMASLASLSVPAMASDLYYSDYGTREVYVDRAPVVERERIIERRYYREPVVESYAVVPRYFAPPVYAPEVVERTYVDVDYGFRRPHWRNRWRHRDWW